MFDNVCYSQDKLKVGRWDYMVNQTKMEIN